MEMPPSLPVNDRSLETSKDQKTCHPPSPILFLFHWQSDHVFYLFPSFKAVDSGGILIFTKSFHRVVKMNEGDLLFEAIHVKVNSFVPTFEDEHILRMHIPPRTSYEWNPHDFH